MNDTVCRKGVDSHNLEVRDDCILTFWPDGRCQNCVIEAVSVGRLISALGLLSQALVPEPLFKNHGLMREWTTKIRRERARRVDEAWLEIVLDYVADIP